MNFGITRRSCVTIAALWLAIGVQAIPAEAQFRLSGGYDITSFFGDGVADPESRASLGFGGSIALFSLGPVILMAEGYYRQKGAESIAEFNQQVFEEGSAEIGLEYIEVPVLLRLNLPTVASRIVPYVNAGPAFAWRIDCGIEFEGSTGGAEGDCDDLMGENIEETLRSYEQGLVLGGGVDIGVLGGVGAINLDARMTQGLTRITESDAEGAEIKNRAFSVMLGYSFGIPGGLGIPGA